IRLKSSGLGGAGRALTLTFAIIGIWGTGRLATADHSYSQGLQLAADHQSLQALEAVRRANHLAPWVTTYAMERANRARQLGFLDEAWQTVQDVIRRHGADPDAWNNFGVAAMWMTQIGGLDHRVEARHAFEKAVQLDPVFVDAWANLAKWHHLA